MNVADHFEAARYREFRSRRLSALTRDALAWCALAPVWPEEVVVGLSEPLNLRVLEHAADAGVLERLPATTPWDRPLFRMAAPLREAALEQLTEHEHSRPAGGTRIRLQHLRESLQQAAKVMLGAEKVQYDPALLRWAALAEHAYDDQALAVFLDEQVTNALDAAREKGSLAAPEALRWIEAAEPFVDIFRGTLESAIIMARGKRELFYRRADDERRLRNYFPPPAERERPARERAFDELMADEEHWALHYVGSGGGGKTMLVRHIAHRLAPAAGAAVARVDFDFLNPDYPLRQPGMQLARFAEELRLQTVELGPFFLFDAQLTSLHEWVAHERHEGRDERMAVDHPLFRKTIDAFASACIKLQRPILLILDTCEELAKLRPDGTIPDNVRVTFDVLETLRATPQMKRQLRVILSGRRALAREGFGWEAPDSSLPNRPFLRLCQITGFTESEALGFLERYGSRGRAVPVELHGEILRLSRTTRGDGEMSRFVPSAADGTPRFNPYDVDMYADWVTAAAEEGRPLAREHLANAGPYFYIEERIAKRVAAHLWRLLPALALLGRFDKDLLQNMASYASAGQDLVLEITEQEWVQPDRGVARDKWVVDPALQERLLRYFADVRPGELEAGRQLLAAILPEITLQRPFAELTDDYFAAVFDALRDQPERAAEWWTSVEQRVLETRAWGNWAQALAASLLAHAVMSPRLPRSFRPAILAFQASSFLHVDGLLNAAIWQQAKESADRYPAVFGRERLHYRINCAMMSLASAPEMPAPPVEQATDAAPSPLERQAWGTLAAAAEAAIERDEGASAAVVSRIRASRCVESLATHSDGYLRAFGMLLDARVMVMESRSRNGREQDQTIGRAVDRFREAAQLASQQTAIEYLDWLPPDDLRSRAVLECLRLTGRDPGERVVSPETPGLDYDRYRAALLMSDDAVMAQRSVVADTSPLLLPRCRAHREVPPHDVAALEIFGRERPLAAIGRLHAISALALTKGIADVATAADRAIARTIRRHRLLSEGAALPASIISSTDSEDVRLRVITRALHLSGAAASAAVADLANPFPVRRGATRRDAEALFDWAELAYLKGEHGAKRQCLEAASMFAASGDISGNTRARIAYGAWLARAGRLPRLQGLVRDSPLPLPGAASLFGYGYAPMESGIPDSQEVKAAHEITADRALAADSLRTLLEGTDPDWRPWAVRAIAATIAAAPDQAAAAKKALATWVFEHYRTEIDWATHLPNEIVLEDTFTWHRFGRFFSAVATVVAAAVFIGAMGLGGWSVSGVFMAAAAWPLRVLATIPLAAALALVSVWFISWFGGAILRVMRPSLEIRLLRPPEDRQRPLTVPWEMRARSRLLFPGTGMIWTMRGTTERRYRYLHDSIRPVRSNTVTRLLGRSTPRMDFAAVTDPIAAAAPWEAVFALPHPDITRLRDTRMHIYRKLTAYRQASQPDWQDRATVVSWIAAGSRIATGDERGSSVTQVGPLQFDLVGPADYDTVRPDAGVVHLVGHCVEVREDVYVSVARSGSLPPYLLAPADLPRRYPHLRVLVLQAPPTDVLERTDSDRLDAANQKRVGAAAFQAGVPCVLIVPSVPAALTSDITSIVYDVVARGSRNATARLILAHRRIQERIAAALPEGDAALEVALDTCLYVDDRVNVHVRR